MTDETLSAGGLDAGPANPGTNTAPEPEALPNSPAEQAGSDTTAQDVIEHDDYEFEGKSYKVPKVLKPKLEQLGNMDAHFTRTNQANSAKAKELEELQSQLNQKRQATEEELTHRAQLQHVNSELKKYEQATWQQWQAWRNQDPAAADEAWQYVQHLKDQKTGVEGKIKEADARRSETAQAEVAKRFQETEAWAAKNIKGWSPETETNVVKFAREHGVPQRFLVDNMSPELIGILHKAMIGDAALKRTATTPSAPPPLNVVGGKTAPGSKSLADIDDMNEYAAARKAGRKG